jgi:integrase/recombinase XerD
VLAGGMSVGHPAGALVAGDEHPLAVYLARLAPGSRRTQAQALHAMAALVTGGALDGWALPWGQLRYAHTHALRALLADRYAPATANRFLAALRGVLREAWRLGQLSGEDLARAVDLPPVRGSRLPAGRAVSAGELAALFGSCGQRPGDIRDAALLAVLYGGGLRRAEAVALEVGDFDPAEASLRVLHGKGRKARCVYLPVGAVAAVTAWVGLRGPAAGPLFHPVNRGGRILNGRSMSGQAVRDVLRRRAAQAGVAPLGPHDLRRTFVSDALDRGADISVVAALCGHASPTTTARYDRRGEVAKKRAAELLFVPYTNSTGRALGAD